MIDFLRVYFTDPNIFIFAILVLFDSAWKSQVEPFFMIQNKVTLIWTWTDFDKHTYLQVIAFFHDINRNIETFWNWIIWIKRYIKNADISARVSSRLVWPHLWSTVVLTPENAHFCLKSWCQKIIFLIGSFWVAYKPKKIGHLF